MRPKYQAAAAPLSDPGKPEHVFDFIFVCSGVGILPDLVTLQLPLWFLLNSETSGSAGSAGAGGPKARVSRASSDRKQGNQTSYDITKTAYVDFCISGESLRLVSN